MADRPKSQSGSPQAKKPEIYTDLAANMEREKYRRDSGWLGGIFGLPDRAPTNIAGIIVVVLLVEGLIVPFLPITPFSEKYWTFTTTAVMTTLGYLFGKSDRSGTTG